MLTIACDFEAWQKLRPGDIFTTTSPITVTWPADEYVQRDEFGFPINEFSTLRPGDTSLVVSFKKTQITSHYDDDGYTRLEVIVLNNGTLWWARLETEEFSVWRDIRY